MSNFWSWYVIIITVGNMVACFWLIKWATRRRSGEAAEGDVTGHTWDDNLQEFNNPLPRWWLWLFYITLVFGFIYFALYPGLGNVQGQFGWSQVKEYQQEMDTADKTYSPIFAKYAQTDVATLAKDSEAMQAGKRLYLSYCSVCHGSDAGGAKGFPNLADNDWLYGGTDEAIKTSIMNGRMGVMPPHSHLDEATIDNVTAFVLSMSGREVDNGKAEAGKAVFEQNCAVCHNADGKGNYMFGAPNLTDNTWLYGASEGVVKQSIRNGRNGQMPAHGEFLGADKVHLLTAYVYSLSAGK